MTERSNRRNLVARLGLPILVALVLVGTTSAGDATGESSESEAELAQELTNPLASLITIPVQVNHDRGIGPRDDGSKLQTNVQPVYPFDFSDDWNLITRTIVPVIWQKDVVPGEGSQFGLGDLTVSLFFSPKKPTAGIIWGVGPVLYLPTATDDLLGAKKWGAGPTAVALTMRGRWTMGVLGNHVWSFAGDDDRADINNTFLQPFVAYTWPSAWTVSVLSESTYNWERSDWAIPLNVAAARLIRVGRLPVSVQAGFGYWLESPDVAADGWRFRLQANLVLPKRR